MVKQKPVKKCKYCNKVIRSYNKSGICSSCRNLYRLELAEGAIKNVRVM